MRSVYSLLLITAVVGVAPEVEAKCAMWGLNPDVLTATGATIAADGGILVGATDAEDGELEPGDVASQPGWRLRIGSRVVQPTLVTIAPGLVLYKLPADAKEASLIDDKRATVGKVTVGPKTPMLGAPKIKRIAYASNQGRKPSAEVTVELAAAPPSGAVALVIADAAGKPRSWRAVEGGKLQQLGYSRRRCKVLANGTVESKPKERVTVFWVDASGRKSPSSAAYAIVPQPVDTGDDE